MASIFELEAPIFGGKSLSGMTYANPAATGTLTIAQTVNAVLSTEQTGAITLTTPTAAELKEAFRPAQVGTSFTLVVVNNGSNHNVTIAGGDDVTVEGVETIARYASKTFIGIFTDVVDPEVKLVGLGSVAAAQAGS